jgi:ABC-type polysaccharide/polyol phosphate export permease
MFKTNLGSIDRLLRLVIGVILIALVFIGPKTPWGWLGLILVATALLSSCPIYSLFGIKTCKSE